MKKPSIEVELDSDDSFDEVDVVGKSNILPWSVVEKGEYMLEHHKHDYHALEGSWRLVANSHFDKYLDAVGVKPLMVKMVSRCSPS